MFLELRLQGLYYSREPKFRSRQVHRKLYHRLLQELQLFYLYGYLCLMSLQLIDHRYQDHLHGRMEPS